MATLVVGVPPLPDALDVKSSIVVDELPVIFKIELPEAADAKLSRIFADCPVIKIEPDALDVKLLVVCPELPTIVKSPDAEEV